jgi:peptidoglycan/LPS O-acetylase OafA/YrhL
MCCDRLQRVGPASFHLGYRAELDGLRGVSILLVLGLHFVPRFVPGGFLGVEVFFVLSGFLITCLLLQEWERTAAISLKDFYVRRVLRLGPALIAYLLTLGLFAAFFLKPENASEVYVGIGLTLAYASNWVLALKPAFPVGILAITWSLSVEEQFYFLWPIALVLLLKRTVSRRTIVLLLIAGIIIVNANRALLFHNDATFRRLYYATDTRADSLLCGCLLACVACWKMLPMTALFERLVKAMAIIATGFLLFLAATLKSSDPLIFKSLLTVATVGITTVITTIVLWPGSVAAMVLRFPPLVWIGRISYGLYLWHWPVQGFVFGPINDPSVGRIVVAVLLSFALASISYYVIERPFLKQKKRFIRADGSKTARLDREELSPAVS